MSGIWKWLQFFAEGASGGDGGDAGTGVTSADAGQSTGVTADDAGQRLEKLGVPKDKADRFRKSMERRGVKPAKNSDDNGGQQNQQAGQGVTWDDFMAIPENQQRLQTMMAERGKSATEARNAANEQMSKFDPVMQLLARRYNVEAKDGKLDFDAIIKAAIEDDLFFEDEALERGESVSKVKSDWQKDREAKQQQAADRERQLQEHFYKMQQQAADLKQEFPNFDFEQELKNPDFVRLTAPDVGFDVRRAFRAAHMDEIEKQQVEAVAARAKADAARAVQAGQARPRENGSSSAPFNATPNLKSMKREERHAYIMSKYPPR